MSRSQLAEEQRRSVKGTGNSRGQVSEVRGIYRQLKAVKHGELLNMTGWGGVGEAEKGKQIGHVRGLRFLLRALEGFKHRSDVNYIKKYKLGL